MAEIVVFVRSRPFFGAQLVMFPALYQLKKWWPEKKLRVVARDSLAFVFSALPWVDEFVHAPTFAAEFAALGSHCDIFIGLHPSSEWHAVLGALRRPTARVGFRNGRMADAAWTHSLPFDTSKYRALHFMQLLQTLRPFSPMQAARESVIALANAYLQTQNNASGVQKGVPDSLAVLRDPAALASGGDLLHAYGIEGVTAPQANGARPAGDTNAGHSPKPHARIITFMPGGGAGEFKKWGVLRFVQLADALAQLAPTRFNFVLGPAELQEERLLRQMRRPDFNVMANASLPQLAAVVVSSDLVVANDCGPSHLAQCAGVPFVGLFDEAKPEWFWQRLAAQCLVPPAGAGLQSLPVGLVVHACTHALMLPQPVLQEAWQAAGGYCHAPGFDAPVMPTSALDA